MTNTLESIARGEVDAASARTEIDRHIQATRDFTKPYSALLRWTWLALSERRADNDLRLWHRLILDIAAKAGKEADPGAEGSEFVLAERLRAMSDMIRVSIGMQSRPDKARLLTRAHVPAILQALNDRSHEAVARADLLEAVDLKTANLSRVLTLLILEGLVERQADGRTARFRITGEGIKHLEVFLARNESKAKLRPVSASKRQQPRLKMHESSAANAKLFEAIARALSEEEDTVHKYLPPLPVTLPMLRKPVVKMPQVETAVQFQTVHLHEPTSSTFKGPQPEGRSVTPEPYSVKSRRPEYTPFEALRLRGTAKTADH